MLRRKMLRELWKFRGQFVSILLMAMLGVGVFAGINAEWVGLKQTTDDYYARTNLADLWVLGEGLTRQDLETVRSLPGIGEAELRLTLSGTASLPGDPEMELAFLNESDRISGMELRSGDAFRADAEGVWLDEDFARAQGLGVGDSISMSAFGFKLDQRIRGLVIHPEYVYHPSGSGEMMPDHRRKGFAFLSDEALPGIVRGRYTQMRVVSADPARAEAEIKQALEGRGMVLLTRDQLPSYAVFDSEIRQHRALGSIFPVVFLLVALLTILTTMRRLIASQRTEIGTLKALGFDSRRILAHYAGYGLALSLAGAALGLLLGPALLPALFFVVNGPVYTLPEWRARVSWGMFAVAALMVLLCALVTALACRAVLKERPAEALRPKPPRAMRRNALERTRLWGRLGFSVQWNLRDALRSRARTVTTLVGVTSCMMLLVCAFGLRDSVRGMVDWQFDDLMGFETKITFEEGITGAQIQAILDELDAAPVMEQAAEFEAGGRKATAGLTAEPVTPLLRHTDADRLFAELPEEGAALSAKLARQLGVGVGDGFRFRVFGASAWTQARVECIVRTPMEQGVFFSRDAYEAAGLTFCPTAAVTGKAIETAPEGARHCQSRHTIQAAQEAFIEVINIMVGVLILAALALAATVLWNLSSMSYTERERELATLRVLGFSNGRIRRLLMGQSLALAALGTVLGWPLGMLLIGFIAGTFDPNMDMPIMLSALSFLLCVLITWGASTAVCLLFSRRVRRIDMVGALKSVE